ncbi:MAG: domain S-box, partial [Chthonomonadales bacterium]|nr:domain S-box [Chthonomonadales bacterium]
MPSKNDPPGAPTIPEVPEDQAASVNKSDIPDAKWLLESILNAGEEEMAVLNREGRFLFVNRSAAEAIGKPPNEIVGKTGLEVGAPAEAVAQFDREREIVFSTGETLAGTVVYPTPQGPRHYDYRWTPLVTEQGEPPSVLLFAARDVTARKREELARELLTRASEVFASSLDYAQTLQQVADLAVPHIADWCGVDMLEADGSISLLAVAHVDPEKIVWALELRKLYPPDPEATTGLPGVLRSGQSELYPYISDELLVASARDARHLEVMRYLSLRSVMIVPIIGRESILGAITYITTQESGHNYTQADLAQAEGLAARAALAIENARLYRLAQEELTERRRIQDALYASEQRFRFALANSSIIVYTQDRDLRYTWIYDGILNGENSRVCGSTDADIMEPDEAAHITAIKQRVLRTGIEERHVIRATPPGEETRYLDTSFAPLRDAAGDILGVTGTANDITVRKKTQDALVEHQAVIETLNVRLQRSMRETHHRVKNNLQVVSALLDMQEIQYADTVPVSEIARLRQHIQALSTIHDLLTHQARTDADVLELSVREAMEKLVPTIQSLVTGRAIAFAIEDLRMPVRHVTTLTVLVNELVSNAIKHGQGEIHLAFAVREGRAVLEVLDRGPGFPDRFDVATAANTGLEL